MRVFDSIDDVKAHLAEEAEKWLLSADGFASQAQRARPRSNDYIGAVRSMDGCRAAAKAYRDALDALNEVRPGLWDEVRSRTRCRECDHPVSNHGMITGCEECMCPLLGTKRQTTSKLPSDQVWA